MKPLCFWRLAEWGLSLENVALTIRERPHKRGLTQEEFAPKVGVAFSAANWWENEESSFSPLGSKEAGLVEMPIFADNTDI